MRIKWLIMTPFILIVIALIAVILCIRPTESLDLSVTEMNWKTKMTQMVESRQPTMKLSPNEMSQFIKYEIVSSLGKVDLPIDISGVGVKVLGSTVQISVNGKWSIVPMGGQITYSMKYQDGQIVLTPISVDIRDLSLTPTLFKLEQVTVNPEDHFPPIIRVKGMDFENDGVRVNLSVDWLEFTQYLLSL